MQYSRGDLCKAFDVLRYSFSAKLAFLQRLVDMAATVHCKGGDHDGSVTEIIQNGRAARAVDPRICMQIVD